MKYWYWITITFILLLVLNSRLHGYEIQEVGVLVMGVIFVFWYDLKERIMEVKK